jgi:hypothetical protein
MNPILSAGLLIGVLCGLWTFVMGFTGWYKDPAMLTAFFVVVPLEVGGLIWGLRKTAAEGRTFSGQVVAGTMMSVVAGVIIICASLLFTLVAFPDYRNHRDTASTPMGEALSGFMGTLVTGIIASAIIAIFVRGNSSTSNSQSVRSRGPC